MLCHFSDFFSTLFFVFENTKLIIAPQINNFQKNINQMVILSSLYGQTSNNYFQYVNIDAYCKENNIKFIAPMFELKYAKKFPNFTKKSGLLIQLLYKNRFTRGVINRISKKITYKLDTIENVPYFKEKLINRNICFVSGWYFSSPKELSLNRLYYKNQFQPLNSILEKKSKYFDLDFDGITLGVHIRRGDYKEFLDGKYYYENDVYIKFIEKFIEISQYNINILIFSNEKIEEEVFSRFENLKISKENVDTDHYLMSECNYLIGPPSTFTMWASYIGKPKCFQIVNPDGQLNLEKFIKY